MRTEEKPVWDQLPGTERSSTAAGWCRCHGKCCWSVSQNAFGKDLEMFA